MHVRHVKPSDVLYLAQHMKAQDRVELKAALGLEPLEGLRASLKDSHLTRTLEVEGQVVAIGGVTKTFHGGLIWLLTVDSPSAFGKTLTKVASKRLDVYTQACGIVYNYVAQSNKTTLRWLRRLGFKTGDKCVFRGEPFILMYRR
ncbi:hypothetical protein [Vibrio sp. SCSIO 43137]|uniref:hypothetical protein n=1 Tax=Vibrio sp. SCSIO 43137 TaxID=3021011 RepID=UPI002306FAA6|nr:hypothetical protein [Vibrio sp. SCSIO 43137]WCE28418.1 hypothetical protein PK654_08505 [Vibrio sp. SCSIO 43137]